MHFEHATEYLARSFTSGNAIINVKITQPGDLFFINKSVMRREYGENHLHNYIY